MSGHIAALLTLLLPLAVGARAADIDSALICAGAQKEGQVFLVSTLIVTRSCVDGRGVEAEYPGIKVQYSRATSLTPR